MRGKFLALGGHKLWLRGVTYGTFRPGPDACPTPARVAADLAQMAASGFNAVRVYTAPPRWLLDLAEAHGLHVLVGLPWEEHVAFLEESGRSRAIERRLREAVRRCAGHPAVLAYAVGNEIPAPIVRWHGRRRVERFLARLAAAARDEDPGALVTYVNYPTTEYLDPPGCDFHCANVYLEDVGRLAAYVARLHTRAGDRPLVLAEIGLDSRRHGVLTQARVVAAQVRAAFAGGCAGAFVFAWTDEWWRGGHDVHDWDFGLTDRGRRPKPALAAVQAAMARPPLPANGASPRISVIVCSYNGARTIRDCLEGLARLEYPDFEVIVVDDGSTDATAAIAGEYPVRLVSTPNRGLGSARNTGLAAATGQIVAYIDDDASPDPHWLRYLAAAFHETGHAAVGGPNIPPPGDGWIAESVAHAPGGPVHVLLTDREAEHVPGCNMAFRRHRLAAIGGFDPRFRTAGDDVDVCWRIRDRGWTIGFSPAAMVWHRRRGSVRAYLRQQRGYGRAEALLADKWPERYNGAGHATWAGRLYGPGQVPRLAGRPRVYHGAWGTALFQSLYEPAPGTWAALPAMPEWWLIIAGLAALTALGASWRPLALTAPLLAVAVAAPLAQAALAATGARIDPGIGAGERRRIRGLVFLLHVLQPLARLWGRLRHGLAPWRRHRCRPLRMPVRRRAAIWSEHWRAATDRLHTLERAILAAGCRVRRGGAFDRWDLEARPGSVAGVRLLAATEEHGGGRQLTRLRAWPRWSPPAVAATAVAAALALAAAGDGAPVAAAVLGAVAAGLLGRLQHDAAAATGAALAAIARLAAEDALPVPAARDLAGRRRRAGSGRGQPAARPA